MSERANTLVTVIPKQGERQIRWFWADTSMRELRRRVNKIFKADPNVEKIHMHSSWYS